MGIHKTHIGYFLPLDQITKMFVVFTNHCYKLWLQELWLQGLCLAASSENLLCHWSSKIYSNHISANETSKLYGKCCKTRILRFPLRAISCFLCSIAPVLWTKLIRKQCKNKSLLTCFSLVLRSQRTWILLLFTWYPDHCFDVSSPAPSERKNGNGSQSFYLKKKIIK